MNYTDTSMSELLSPYLGTMQGALIFVLPFVLPVFSHFVLYTPFHFFLIANISCTISCTYVTAIVFIMHPCCPQSLQSDSIQLYFAQTA